MNDRPKDPTAFNTVCLMCEGGFNVLGNGLLGLTSLVPIFLAEHGVGIVWIGMIPTLQMAARLAVPLLLGLFIYRMKSKKRFNMTMNGIFRPSILAFAILLIIFGATNIVVAVFLVVLMLFLVSQSMSGIAWQYLVSASIRPENRAQMLGKLLIISGIASIASGFVVKLVLGSAAFTPDIQYAIIFGMAGVSFTLSVVAMSPLKETLPVDDTFRRITLKEYVGSVSGSLKIKPFRGLIALNVLYSLATCANAYVFVFARSALHATDETVSSMIMVQLVGQVAGGFLLGRVSKRFGNKPILLIACSFVILLPVFLLLAMKYSAAAALLLFLSSFCMGLKASGDTGIDNYLYSIFKPERIIFSIVARAIFLFPLSFASIAIGGVIEHSSYVPVFVFQLAVSALTMLFVIRMKAVEDVKA
jgi:hypothetical protein